MKKISLIILYLSGFMCFAQELSGVVTDGLNKQPIPGAKIELKELNLATYSKADGTFSLTGEWPDQLDLEVSMATYQTKNIKYFRVIKKKLYETSKVSTGKTRMFT